VSRAARPDFVRLDLGHALRGGPFLRSKDSILRNGTTGLQMSARPLSATEAVHRPAAHSRANGGRLYAWFAVVAALTIFAGFGRTLYLRSISGAPTLSPLLLVHGIVMTTWFVLFCIQVWLVATGHVRWHRRLGLFGIAVALAVVYVGIDAAIDAARRGVGPAHGVATETFMAIPLFDMPVFALLVGIALWRRRRPDIHKRLMLLASLGMLTPAIARIPLGLIQAGGPPVFFGLALGIVGACIAVDTLRNGRLHPAFGWGGALIFAMVPLRLLIAQTPAWSRVAAWLVS
jgi:hypothetical protein